jgi:BirA family transcriptional regulator, biotin operon repressor / biotin---[acetyl-CoA-carboxylase] ligase
MTLFKNIHTLRFDTIDSTHTWGKKNISSLDPYILFCVSAKEQTAGYGRHQRTWHSPKDHNIHATFCFSLPLQCPFIGNLGQLLCLSAATLLEKTGFTPEIKWPNDVRVEGKKIAGVLCETFDCQDRRGVVLSIGLNINMPGDLLETINQPATSLLELSGKMWNIEEVLDKLIQQFSADFSILYERGFAAFKDEYERLLAFKQQTIRSFDGVQMREGICQGILVDGRLKLSLTNGETIYLSAGELIN